MIDLIFKMMVDGLEENMHEDETLVTKYGMARINNRGYYRITSHKEGNHNKLLHRLVWEEHYGEIPEGYVIHHKNKVKTDNRIKNLELIEKSKHHSLHNKGENHPCYGLTGEEHPRYGKKHSQETREMMSKVKNKSGYFRVSKNKDRGCKQGFRWRYQYYEDGKRKTITNINLDKLREKVLAKGLVWREI